MTQLLDANPLLNKKTIRADEVKDFFEAIDSGLVNNDSREYFQLIEDGDFTKEFEEMLKDR